MTTIVFLSPAAYWLKSWLYAYESERATSLTGPKSERARRILDRLERAQVRFDLEWQSRHQPTVAERGSALTTQTDAPSAQSSRP